jgi:hypothetical protein
MFSIIVLFSNDRIEYLRNSIELFKQASEYYEAEKILLVDGKLLHNVDDFKIIEVERKTKYYCWADVINLGVQSSSNEIVFYFDCDRVVQKKYFEICMQILQKESVFVYATDLYQIKRNMNINELKLILTDVEKYKNDLCPDFRISDPFILSRKNPFSGGVGFHKEEFLNAGGFSNEFKGWGYPDYDFFMKVYKKNSKLLRPIPLLELHQFHPYDKHKFEVCLHNIWNANKYIEKYQINEEELEKILFRINLKFGSNIKKNTIANSKDLDDFLYRCKKVSI